MHDINDSPDRSHVTPVVSPAAWIGEARTSTAVASDYMAMAGMTLAGCRSSMIFSNKSLHVKEVFGRLIGDTEARAEVVAKQVNRTAQDSRGHARDAASCAARAARDTASSFDNAAKRH
jgi:uncharacterized protein YjbJ (UPF0337 family)